MTNLEKIAQLRAEIKRQLEPLLGGCRCIYLDAPYHSNIGDVCIWEGGLNFLSEIGANITETHSLYWAPGKRLDPDVVIVLHGGGNFGDLYRACQDFRLKIIETYPDNRIVMLPQSVWYDNDALIADDAAAMARHRNLWLCARDSAAFRFMQTHFGANHVLLVPDMAFCLPDVLLQLYRHKEQSGKSLFMRRTDNEITGSTPDALGDNVDVHDWPTFEGKYKTRLHIMNQTNAIQWRIGRYSRLATLPLQVFADRTAKWFLRPRLTRCGLKFLSEYDSITTTRLHALILGTLLGKQINIIDNKTGKLTDFTSTWLTDLDSIYL